MKPTKTPEMTHRTVTSNHFCCSGWGGQCLLLPHLNPSDPPHAEGICVNTAALLTLKPVAPLNAYFSEGGPPHPTVLLLSENAHADAAKQKPAINVCHVSLPQKVTRSPWSSGATSHIMTLYQQTRTNEQQIYTLRPKRSLWTQELMFGDTFTQKRPKLVVRSLQVNKHLFLHQERDSSYISPCR